MALASDGVTGWLRMRLVGRPTTFSGVASSSSPPLAVAGQRALGGVGGCAVRGGCAARRSLAIALGLGLAGGGSPRAGSRCAGLSRAGVAGTGGRGVGAGEARIFGPGQRGAVDGDGLPSGGRFQTGVIVCSVGVGGKLGREAAAGWEAASAATTAGTPAAPRPSPPSPPTQTDVPMCVEVVKNGGAKAGRDSGGQKQDGKQGGKSRTGFRGGKAGRDSGGQKQDGKQGGEKQDGKQGGKSRTGSRGGKVGRDSGGEKQDGKQGGKSRTGSRGEKQDEPSRVPSFPFAPPAEAGKSDSVSLVSHTSMRWMQATHMRLPLAGRPASRSASHPPSGPTQSTISESLHCAILHLGTSICPIHSHPILQSSAILAENIFLYTFGFPSSG